MILPTRRAVWVFGSLALAGLLVFISPIGVDVMLLGDALVLAAVLLDGRLAVPAHALGVERIAAVSFTQGRATEVRYRWTNRTTSVARLAIRELRPQRLGGLQPARSLEVPAGASRMETLAIEPQRRGRETAGALVVRSRGPLGLGVRQATIPLPWSVIVYPVLPASTLRASLAAATRRREAGLRPVRAPGEGRQFERLREWVPGDDTRSIDWKATARRRTVITRQFEDDRRQHLLMVLDAGRAFTAEINGQARIEFVIRAAQRLALAAVHHDDNVGVLTFGQDVASYVMPHRGRRGLRAVLDVLAVTEANMVEPDYPAAFRYLAMKNRKRALVVVFTDVIDRTASQALLANAAQLRPRHLPLIVTLRNTELESAATQRPRSAADAHRKAAAEALLTAREGALAQMRRAGLMVLDVEPERADAQVVRRYLDLKARGRI